MGETVRWLAALLGVGAAAYAGLALYLYAFQARYVYYPDLPTRQVTATPADIGLAFEAVRIEVFHRLGLNVFIIDYRGYGTSTGRPGEEGTYRDALAAWTYLTQRKRLTPERIVLFGESLGGSIAAWLAARHAPAGLVLYASFTSVPDMARALYPMFPATWLARYRYDTRTALGSVTSPVLIMHSPEDEIVPFSHAQALLASARGPKRLVALRGGHNEAVSLSRDLYVRGIGEFLQTLPSGRGAAAAVVPE